MNSLGQARFYWDTVRHLRPAQVVARAWCRLPRPGPDMSAGPPLRAPGSGVWMAPACRRASQIGPTEFRFLSRTCTLADHGWDDTTLPKLWRYNLHYFDDLNATNANQRTAWHRDLIARWIAENPPGPGTGWEPYPTSLRIVNWIKWARGQEPLSADAVQSLAVQVRWLASRLEYHLLGNHLFANAKALVFAGCFFDGAEAEQWRAMGLRILAREIPEQILPDGGQFERSPMYHALALEDMLDLVNILRSAGLDVPAMWMEKIAAMRAWLAAMSHPDGEIAFFNDAAIGIAPSAREMDEYAARLGFGPSVASASAVTWLRDSGYIRFADDRAVALLDVAPVGPDYLPGHAHADSLSFELSVDGHRVIVNSGTSEYGTGPERQRQRGTPAHSTVTVADENSSEVWSGFRVARRARPYGLSVVERDGSCTITCSHDGYERLPGRPRHRREWQATAGRLAIRDTVEGGRHRAVAMFHIHPDLNVAAGTDARQGAITAAAGPVVRWQVRRGQGAIQPSSWHPEFGITLPSRRLVVELEDGESDVLFSWSAESAAAV